ncbi:NAD(P)H-binding protein [Rhodovulum sp. DZ06]|uniref:NmrA family NAD(P)-binding protein n=1 Tax=Rhodovulum sp. DZ06 TaxID=3425126 RepID=UPI003D33F11E
MTAPVAPDTPPAPDTTPAPVPPPATVLVTGAAGRFGPHAVRAFLAEGFAVRALLREGRAVPGGLEGAEIARGDASDPGAMAAAARGAALIVQGAHPPYARWKTDQAPMTEALLRAARAAGAAILIPGNVYAYGPHMPGTLTEAGPFRGAFGKPLVRRRMEERLRAAATGADGGDPVQVIQLRAGDFIDTRPGANWFESVIAPKAGRGRLGWPGRRADLPHAWAYLPDYARACAALALRRADLPAWTALGFEGWSMSGEEMRARIETASGIPQRLRPFPWWALRLAAPVWPLARELREMRYLWDRPHRVDGADFAALVPEFRPTPMEAGLAESLRGLGALPEAAPAAPRDASRDPAPTASPAASRDPAPTAAPNAAIRA